MANQGINHWTGSFGSYHGEASALGMCTGCQHYSFVKGNSDPYKCDCGTSACEAQRLADGKSTGKCEAFLPGSAADKKAANNKHKGKFGIGAGVGQMFNGAFGQVGGGADGEQIVIGAGKVALGGAALLGKGLFGLGKLAAKGISKGIEASKEAKAQEEEKEEQEAEQKQQAHVVFRNLPIQGGIDRAAYAETTVTELEGRQDNEELSAGEKFQARAHFEGLESEGEAGFAGSDGSGTLYCKLTVRPPMMLEGMEVIGYFTATDSDKLVCDGIEDVDE